MLRSSGVYLSVSTGEGGRTAAAGIALVSDTGLFADSLDLCRGGLLSQHLQDSCEHSGILFGNMRPVDSFRLRNAVRLIAPALGRDLLAIPGSAGRRGILPQLRLGAVLSALRILPRIPLFGRNVSVRLVRCMQPRAVPGLRAESVARRARLIISLLSGRVLTFAELASSLAAAGETGGHDATRIAVDSLSIAGRLEMVPGVQQMWTGRARCSRCGSGSEIRYSARCDICRGRCAMCLCCSSLGLMTSCTWLLHVPAGDGSDRAADRDSRRSTVTLSIPFQLTQAQRRAANRVQEFVSCGRSREFLVWAACGSGKTEVVCPAIESVLNRGGTVLYVVPRQSAAGDIHARLDAFFMGMRVGLQSGLRRIAAQDARLLVCTAHQTLRLRHVADLAVFDEVDAYPCVPGGFLENAVRRSVRPGGKIVYLTATPDSVMFERIRRRSLSFCLISTRHHGRPLPVPRVLSVRTARAGVWRPDGSGISGAGEGCPLKDINRPPADGGCADSCTAQIVLPRQCLCRRVEGAASPFSRYELCLLCAAAADRSPTLVFDADDPTCGATEVCSASCRGIAGRKRVGVLPLEDVGQRGRSEAVEGRPNHVGRYDHGPRRSVTIPGSTSTVMRADSRVFDARSLATDGRKGGQDVKRPDRQVAAVDKTCREVEAAIKIIVFMNDRLAQ